MTEVKYDHRMVVRNTLGDLEESVRGLESIGWELRPDIISPNLVDCLNSVKEKKGMTVPMRRAQDG